MSLTKLNYFEEKIARFLEEDRQENKSYGEMAEFQTEITEEFLTWVKEDNNTFYSDVEVITEWFSELRENAMEYINVEAYYNMMSEILEEKESELEDLIEDHKEEWAQDYASWYGIDCDDEYYDIGFIDEFFKSPSDLLDAMRGEAYHGEDWFKYGTYGIEFSDDGTDWEQVFEDYEVRDKVLDGDRCINNDYGVEDLAQEIEDIKEALTLIEDLLNE